jgi:hypothetical protein
VAYYVVEDFKAGMDLRKSAVTAPAGTLRLLRNAVITPGAEIEKRMAFVPWRSWQGDDPVLGMVSRNGKTYLVVPGASGIVEPVGDTVGYVRIPNPTGKTLAELIDWDLFDSKFFLVVKDSTGATYGYFDQVQVTDAGFGASDYIRTYRSKMYALDGRYLRFSAVGDPKVWTAPTDVSNGAGFIDLSAQDADSTNLVALEVYYGNMAIFSDLSTQIWKLDPDDTANAFQQLLRQTGCIARHTLTQYGSGDVLYLSSFGIRSLRARDIAQTATVTDIGTPLDKMVQHLIQERGTEWFAKARALLQPRAGRLWLVLQDRVLVLSTFQEPTVTAWSIFDFDTFGDSFRVVDSVVADPHVVLRGNDGWLYRYGGRGLDKYDNCMAEVITPFLALDAPGLYKNYSGFDAACEGTWNVSIALEPAAPDAELEIGVYTNSTFMGGAARMPGSSTHISLRLRTDEVGPATLGKLVIHYDKGMDE